MKFIATLLILTLTLNSCTSQQIQKGINSIFGNSGSITSQEASSGLKEALLKGMLTATDLLSKEDGYYGNSLVKIPWPEEAEFVKNALTTIGMGNKVEEVTKSLNRAAEKAAGEAVDVFVEAVTNMTFQDAMGIVTGGDGAATDYLVRSTTASLTERFRPIIDNSLGQVNATKIWSEVIERYNKIPFSKKVETDLTEYVTRKAMEGLFVMVEKKENEIRHNVNERTSGTLQKVFGYADQVRNNQ